MGRRRGWSPSTPSAVPPHPPPRLLLHLPPPPPPLPSSSSSCSSSPLSLLPPSSSSEVHWLFSTEWLSGRICDTSQFSSGMLSEILRLSWKSNSGRNELLATFYEEQRSNSASFHFHTFHRRHCIIILLIIIIIIIISSSSFSAELPTTTWLITAAHHHWTLPQTTGCLLCFVTIYPVVECLSDILRFDNLFYKKHFGNLFCKNILAICFVKMPCCPNARYSIHQAWRNRKVVKRFWKIFNLLKFSKSSAASGERECRNPCKTKPYKSQLLFTKSWPLNTTKFFSLGKDSTG